MLFSIHKSLRSPLIRLDIRSTPSPVWEKALIVVNFAKATSRYSYSKARIRLLLGENWRMK